MLSCVCVFFLISAQLHTIEGFCSIFADKKHFAVNIVRRALYGLQRGSVKKNEKRSKIHIHIMELEF